MPAKKTVASKAKKPLPKSVAKVAAKAPKVVKKAPKAEFTDSCCGDDCCKEESCCKDGTCSCCCGKGRGLWVTIVVLVILAVVAYFGYMSYLAKKTNVQYEVKEDDGVTTVIPGPGLAPDGPPVVVPPTLPPPTK